MLGESSVGEMICCVTPREGLEIDERDTVYDARDVSVSVR